MLVIIRKSSSSELLSKEELKAGEIKMSYAPFLFLASAKAVKSLAWIPKR